MPVPLLKSSNLKLVTLLSILTAYAEAEAQPKPYLIKDGLKIIF